MAQININLSGTPSPAPRGSFTAPEGPPGGVPPVRGGQGEGPSEPTAAINLSNLTSLSGLLTTAFQVAVDRLTSSPRAQPASPMAEQFPPAYAVPPSGPVRIPRGQPGAGRFAPRPPPIAASQADLAAWAGAGTPGGPGGGGPTGLGGGGPGGGGFGELAGLIPGGAAALVGAALIAVRSLEQMSSKYARLMGEVTTGTVRGLTSDPEPTALYTGYRKLSHGIADVAASVPIPGIKSLIEATKYPTSLLEEISTGIDRMATSVEGLSPEVAVADAMTQIRVLQARMDRAERLGSILADIREQRGQIRAELMELGTTYTKVVAPGIEAIEKNALEILRFLNDVIPRDALANLGTVLTIIPNQMQDLIRAVRAMSGDTTWIVDAIRDMKGDFESRDFLDEIKDFLDPEKGPEGDEYYPGRSGPPKKGPFARR